MGLTDLYYRAFRAFRQHTLEEADSRRLRKAIAHAQHKQDSLVAIKYDCTIEPDWIENIEAGLVYVEKAIREDRQFIRTEGEVIPIEKVKRVSKASVEHLSKHSNLITRLPKDKQEDLTPEKLYVVEKLNDYLVYENRFLYLLLCHLKDFIQMRLDVIKDKATSYQTHVTMQKELDKDQRHLRYELHYDDVYKNDPLLVERYQHIPLVDRVETIFATVVAYMNMPLMKEVGKAPLISLPVVKTNVLRMNPNFKEALKLYEYISAYRKDGYTIQEIKKTFNPFDPAMADEMAETVQLTANIAYIVGNDLREELAYRLDIKQRALQKSQSEAFKEELNRLKKRILELNEDPTEYMLKLEKRNIELERNGIELAQEKERNDVLKEQIEKLNDEKRSFENTIHKLDQALVDKDQEMTAQHTQHLEAMAAAETAHNQALSDLQDAHEEAIQTINENHEAEKEALLALHEEAIEALNLSHQEATTALEVKILHLNDKVGNLDSEIEQITASTASAKDAFEQTIQSLEARLERLDEEKRFAQAQYKALQQQQGLLEEQDDYLSKKRFRQLELEMNAYKKLFKEQWRKAKSQIREKVKEETYTKNNQQSD